MQLSAPERDELVDLPHVLKALLNQEQTTYRIPDYLSPYYVTDKLCYERDFTTTQSSKVDDNLRAEIAQWAYSVIDYFSMDRQTVSITLSYFDRFMCALTVTKKAAQLVVLGGLYLATKIFESEWKHRLPELLTHLVKLSANNFTSNQIIEMEAMILRTLKYHIHPPTPQSISQQLLLLIPKTVSSYSINHIAEHANFLIELSVCEYFFVPRRPSSVALASLLVAMDDQTRISPNDKYLFNKNVRDVANISTEMIEVLECKAKLVSLFQDSMMEAESNEDCDDSGSVYNSRIVSPVSVTET